jgi:hypothetical protein
LATSNRPWERCRAALRRSSASSPQRRPSSQPRRELLVLSPTRRARTCVWAACSSGPHAAAAARASAAFASRSAVSNACSGEWLAPVATARLHAASAPKRPGLRGARDVRDKWRASSDRCADSLVVAVGEEARVRASSGAAALFATWLATFAASEPCTPRPPSARVARIACRRSGTGSAV